MRITVRDIITNSLDEAKLVNRNQPVPGNIFVSALSLLKKRLAQYSNTNYLSFTRKEYNFIPEKEVTLLGEKQYLFDVPEDEVVMLDVLPTPSHDWLGKTVYVRPSDECWTCREMAVPHSFVYVWNKVENVVHAVDEHVMKLQETVRVYIQPKDGNDNWHELNFVAYEDYYNYNVTSEIYSVLPKDESTVALYIKKPYSDGSYRIKVIYNEAFDFDADSELNIPNQFVALFTAGLVYDLALQFPRLSDNTVVLLKQRLDELEENVRRSSSVTKFIARDYNTKTSWTYADGIAGRFLGV